MFDSLRPKPAVKFDLLFGQMKTGIALLDAESHLIYTNPAFCEQFAVSPSRSRGLPLAALGEPARIFAPVAERVRAGAVSVLLREQVLEIRSGRILHVDISVNPSIDDSVLIEVHELGAEISAATPTRWSESLRGLAHEVKNPLAGLRGAAQLLSRRLIEPDLKRLAELIMAEADRLGALTNRLLQPNEKPHLSVVNLHEVTERARALIAAEADSALRLERDYDPSLPNLRGNSDRLLQLVLNLMRNALQAKTSYIGLRTRAEHNLLIGDKPTRLAVRLDIIDDGSGVPENLRHTLFMPLVSGRAKGTGLGLALAQEIALEHGGALSYRSRPGHTVFSLILPLGNDPPRVDGLRNENDAR